MNEIMKNLSCLAKEISYLELEELKKNERKYRLERDFFLYTVMFLAVAFVTTAWFVKESVAYTVISSSYMSIGFVLVMMIDQASKKLARVRRVIKRR